MKITDVMRTASSSMLRSKARTILTIIAIFIGALTLTLTNGIGSGIATYIDEQVGNIGAEDMLIIAGKSDNPLDGEPQKYEENVNISNSDGIPTVVLSLEDVEKVKAEPGIKSAELDYNVGPNYLYGPGKDKYKATAGAFYTGINVLLASGAAPSNTTDENQLLLSPAYAKVLGFATAESAVGQTVTFGMKTPAGEQREVKGKVLGVQEQSLMNAGGIMLNRHMLLELFNIQTEGLPEEAKNHQPIVTARFDTSLSEEKLDELKERLDKKGYTATTIKDQIGIFKQVIDAIIMVLNFFAGIALLAASFGIVNTLLMSVQERTKEIGLMKALGMGNKKVFLLFSSEAILLGFWGSLLGSLAGIGIGKLANTVASKTFLKDLKGFELTSFPLTSVITIMLVIMAIAFLAGTLPARRASKKDPIEALRYE